MALPIARTPRTLLLLSTTLATLPLVSLLACGQLTAQITPRPPANLQPSPPPTPPPIAPPTQLRVTQLQQNLKHPWAMAWLPDQSLLITERAGQLKRLAKGKLDSIPGVPQVFADGQGGLLDIAPHPRFSQNQLLYFTYAQGRFDANRTRVARARFDGKRLTNWQDLLSATPTKSGNQHFGSRLLWLPDGTLLISIGDGGNPPLTLNGELIRTQAQKRTSHLGKLLRIQDDGSVPTNNPWANQTGVARNVWSYGHRNIQGLAWDPIRQRVWATEHGARGGDELNAVASGQNYGWPIVSFSRDYRSGEPIAPNTKASGLIDPRLVWTPAIAPSGLAVYRSDRPNNPFPQWQGDLLAGGLVSRDIKRLRINSAGQVEGVESIAIGARVRDVRQGPDGFIYVLTDQDNGQLLRLDGPG